MKTFTALIQFFLTIIQNHRIILSLTKQDLKQRFAGNILGILWAFVGPLVTIAIMWFVFEVGFKVGPTETGVPYILWLMAGMVPWLFFADSISQGMHSIIDKPYLVKKIVFRVSTLPVIKILSSFAVHLFFMGILIVMFTLIYRQPIFWTYLQIPYYTLCTAIFVMGFSWITSSVIVFLRDIGQIVGVMLQFGFWLTPVFWPYKMVPEKYQIFLKLNPAYYIVEGYRDSLIHHVWFWERPGLTLYFWILVFSVGLLGAIVFRQLRPHFADVL